jgi:hypothetical protein
MLNHLIVQLYALFSGFFGNILFRSFSICTRSVTEHVRVWCVCVCVRGRLCGTGATRSSRSDEGDHGLAASDSAARVAVTASSRL